MEKEEFNDDPDSFIKHFNFKRTNKSDVDVDRRKRQKSGHINTKLGFCLKCFEDKKDKFWLSRYHKSTITQHIKTTHKGKEFDAQLIVPENSIMARDAHKEYTRIQEKTNRPTSSAPPKAKETVSPRSDVCDNAEGKSVPLSMAATSDNTSVDDPSESLTVNEFNMEELHEEQNQVPKYQGTLHLFLRKTQEQQCSQCSGNKTEIDKLSDAIANKVAKLLAGQKSSAGIKQPARQAMAEINNLEELSEAFPDFQVSPFDKRPNTVKYDQKFKIAEHMSSDTHVLALQHQKSMQKENKTRTTVVQNQIRTALGVVKSKSAAIQYETRIAELHKAGASVGDYGHSRKLFNDMAKVACSYVDKKTRQFYTSDGETGKGEALASAIIKDLELHAGIKGEKLMQMQGKCTDGQYLNAPFETAMQRPITELIERYEREKGVDLDGEISNPFWWPVQWDPGHWIYKVFGAYKDTPFVSRILKRTALYHQLFGHGKLHSVARETAKELKLPFRVTNSFAHQRFMGSSYLSLQNLPLVVLMLEGQASWVPGWKFTSQKQRNSWRKLNWSLENPSTSICPWFGRHIDEIRDLKFGKSQLEVGWLVVEEKEGKPVRWEAREIKECVSDLQDLAEKLVSEMDERYKSSFSDLNILLSECLDFGMLVEGLCGEKEGPAHPVSKKEFSKLGLEAFKKCVRFVSGLPHIVEQNFELSEDFAFTIFWSSKSALVEAIWGSLFCNHFSVFFREVVSLGVGKCEVRQIKRESVGDHYVVKFSIFSSPEFTLANLFEVKTSNGKKMVVALEERNVIELLYIDEVFYTLVGSEFCLVFDIMYAKTGTEAAAESFYR
eukprot:gene2259-2590_t